MTYDLIERPWLRLLRSDGAVEEVGLRRALIEAHTFRSLAGDLATQDVAVLRLLLALVHRAYREHLDQPDAKGWARLWAAGALPPGPVEHYLETQRERLDLLHPLTPFLQVAGLRTANGGHSGVVVLLPDVRNNGRLFSTRAGAGLDALPTAEAARWLVTCHAFDPSGIKSGAIDDRRVKGGKGYPIGTGWAGNLGLVIPEGSTLKDTLLLNLARPDDGDSAADLPVWERDPLTGAAELRPSAPTGPVDLYTWPSRRIRLFGDSEQITGVLVCNGDRLEPHDRMGKEPMTGWRSSKNQAKKLGRPVVHMPRTHDPARALWRGLAPLLIQTHTGTERETLPALTLERLAGWHEDGLLADDTVITLRAVGLVYGLQSAVESGLVDDALSLPVALLGAGGAAAREVATAAVDAADRVGVAVGQLARNLAQAAGGPGEGAWTTSREQFFAGLEEPFQSWLRTLPTSDLDEAAERWERVVAGLALELGGRLVVRSGPAAWTGREVRGAGAASRVIDVPLAELWFRRAVYEALPHTAPARPPLPQEAS